MITQSRQSWGRKPSCHKRMLGSDADTPWAAALTANESDLTKIPANTKSSHKNCADWSQRTIKLKVPSAADQYPEQGRKSEQSKQIPSPFSSPSFYWEEAHCGAHSLGFTLLLCWFLFHLYQVKLNIVSNLPW